MRRRNHNRSRREVFQCHRVVLKGRIQVGHGRVPRIPGIGEKTEIGEIEFPNHLGLVPNIRELAVHSKVGMNNHE
ncbi:MAG: hypothetical protein AB1442_15075 [Nitrospirota bacterium]